MKIIVCATILFFISGCSQNRVDDLFSLAQSRQSDLRLGVYITSHSVELLSTQAGRREALSLLRCNGITHIYLEVYRSGLVVPVPLLREVRDFFQKNSIEVTGGIATVPGGDFGVRQSGRLDWFNWQNEKTQRDLKKVMRDVAPIFDTFIVDDFLCTADTSDESKMARGEQSWSAYRRALLTRLAGELFIDAAKEVHPGITMIIKYPQWYDRFHLFGYDVESGPRLFDRVWVGTETRGQYTQRYGFVQPYEGFVNYRWLASLSGDKIAGAWFDHGDCDEQDFIEQAYQTVLAGAKEIVLFEYGSFVHGHRGHHLLRQEFENLANLAQVIARQPVTGVAAYKPPHSDAGGDLYIMDFIGMFGVPLIPVSRYPERADVLFLPTQAAADPAIWDHVQKSLQRGARIILTTGFLNRAPQGREFCQLAGIGPVKTAPMRANEIIVNADILTLERPLDFESPLVLTDADMLLAARVGSLNVPFLTRSKKGDVYVLNVHTFSPADFDAVGEVLLCPRQLGLLDVPSSWADEVRAAFNSHLNIELSAPTLVILQPLGDAGWMIHNYNMKAVQIEIKADVESIFDGFTGELMQSGNKRIILDLPARSRKWLVKG